MSQTVSNSGERRASMLQFGGVFILTVALSCFIFLRSCGMYQALPAQELKLLKEKETVVAALGDLGDRLRAFENAQRSNSPSVTMFQAGVGTKSVAIHGMLTAKDTTIAYKDVNKVLNMADYYFALIKNMGSTEGPMQTKLALLQSEKEGLLRDLDACIKAKDKAERDAKDAQQDVRRLEIQMMGKKKE